MSKGLERAHEAARAIDEAGDRATAEAIDAWLRQRDGVGCSMREASKAAGLVRWQSKQRIDAEVERIMAALNRNGLRDWERIEVMRQLAKRRKRIGRVGE